MAKIILVTGGCRSGKSSFAQRYAERCAESMSFKKIYLATSPVIDGDLEMKARIEKHKRDRSSSLWETIEEELDLKKVFIENSNIKAKAVILVECLTLWVNNLLYHNPNLQEENFLEMISEIFQQFPTVEGQIIFVTNELGMGLVPENALSRKYRDFVGRLNQLIAARADEVYFIVSGISVRVK